MFSLIDNVVNTASDAVGNVSKTVVHTVGDAVHTASSTVGNVVDTAAGVVGDAATGNVTGLVTNAATGVLNTTASLVGNTVGTAGHLASNIIKVASGVTGGAFKTLDDLVNNLPKVVEKIDEIHPLDIKKNEELNFDEIEAESKEFDQTLPPSTLEDVTMLVPNLIAKYGYPSEIHTISTQDGYNLDLHRIPHGKSGPTQNRRAVLVVHNILGSSADFVVPGTEAGLGYILADAGYDVWLANCRGNRYSRTHSTLNPSDSQFWNFSFHEIGIYDCSAMINYILAETHQPKIYYVGHGQGSTAGYVLLSEKPEYNEKLALFASLGPIAFVKHIKSPLLQFISYFSAEIRILNSLIGQNEFLPNNDLLAQAARYISSTNNSPTQILFTNVLFVLCGFTPSQMNQQNLPVIMGHTPAGCSTKQIMHYIQEVNSGRFCQCDYGAETNKSVYKSDSPPDYALSNVTCPNVMFYSDDDWLANVLDVENLISHLTSTNDKEGIKVNGFNHLDYVYGIDAPAKIYPTLLDKISHH